jgi:hypothetical protein
MSGHQRHHLLSLAVATSLGLMALGVSMAQGHTHPTAIERAAPAVVFIEAKAHVEVTLVEHEQLPDKQGSHVHVFQYSSDPVLDTASGFFVEPNGTVVTTGALLRQRLTPGEFFAVNQAFAKRYPQRATWPANLSTRQHIGARTDRLEQRLQACYSGRQSLPDAGGCVISSRLNFVVHPYVTSQATDGNLPAEQLRQSTKDVGLLRVHTNGVPTVRLAPPVATDYALDVLGFIGIPGAVSTVPDPKNTNPHGEHDIVQHFAKPGGPVLKSVGLAPAEAEGSAMLRQQLGKGVEGGPVVDGGKDPTSGGRVIGLIPGPAPPAQPVPTLVGATTILSVLQSAGVENKPSLTDAQFEAAMHHFKNKEYAASIPLLTNTLKQFRGHALAAADLAIAKDQVKKGMGSPNTTPPAATNDTSGSASSSRRQLLTVGLTAAALVALVVLGLTLRQRERQRRREAGDVVTASPTGPGPTSVAAGDPATQAPRPTSRGAPASARGQTMGPPMAGTPGGAPEPSTPRVRERTGMLGRAPSTTTPATTQPSTHRPSPIQPSTHQPSAAPRPQNSDASPVHRLKTPAQTASTAPTPGVTKFCTSCGGRLSSGHRFCGRCGAPVG